MTDISADVLAEIKTFVKERDEMLMAGDIDRLIAFHEKHNPSVRAFPNREVAEISLHKARTGAKSLPFSYRAYSKKWLLDRGYTSLDDGDIPTLIPPRPTGEALMTVSETQIERGCRAACLHEHGDNLAEGSSLLTPNAIRAWRPFVQAILTAALSDQAGGWLPIESAVGKDGWISRCLFGKQMPWGWSSWVGQRDGDDIWLGVQEDGACWNCGVPTHWQPLPAPPPATPLREVGSE